MSQPLVLHGVEAVYCIWGVHCCMQCMSLLKLRYRTIHMCKSKYSLILKNLCNFDICLTVHR